MEFFLLFAAVLAGETRPASPALPLRGGQWELVATFEMTGPALAPAPERASVCLDASDAKNPRRALAAVPVPGSACAPGDFRILGSSVSWTAACSGRYHGSAEGELTFSSESAGGRLVLRVVDARGAGHEVAYRLEATRSGACAR